MTSKQYSRKRPSTSKATTQLFPNASFPNVDVNNLIVEVTPALATQWLENNITNNRKIMPNLVKKYTLAMRSDEWKPSDPLKFDKEGNLLDGQHRLEAVKLANKPVKFVVLWGYDPVAAQYVDQGKSRNTEHVAQLMGKAYTSQHSSLVRAMLMENSSFCTFRHNLSHHFLISLIDQYMPNIQYAKQVVNVKGSPLNKAAFLSVLARASHFYNVIEEPETANATRLGEAITALQTGIINNPETDSAILRLRDYIMTNKYLIASQADRYRLFYVSDYFLWSFMNNSPRKRITIPSDYSCKIKVPALDDMTFTQ